MVQGWLIIGTKLDTKQLEKDLKEAERELKKFELEEEKLLSKKAKIEIELQGLEQGKAKIRSATDEMLKQATTSEQVKNTLAIENIELDKLTQKYSKQTGEIEEINQKLKENAKNQGLVASRVEETNAKLQNSKSISNMSQDISNVADQTKNLIRQVGRWALAVFSVRSAYMFVRQASSTLAQYDEQYSANLEYIRFVLAQMIAPILYYIVNLAYKLLSYINAIANAWFGINLFGKAGVNNFKKMAGSAESIKKSLQTAGFDEMNVLTDTSGGGAGGGSATPSIDLSKMQGEVPSWMQWILDNKDTLIAGLLGIAAGAIAISLGFGGIVGLGLGLIVGGIIKLIGDIVDLITDPSWDNFADVLIDIGIILAGLALVIGAWPLAVAAAIAVIVGLVIKYWDEIVAVLSKVGKWIYDNVIKPVADFFKGLWDGIVNGVTKAVQKVKDIFNTVKTFFSNIVNTIISLFKTIGTKVRRCDK